MFNLNLNNIMASHLPSEELNRHEPLFDCSVPVTVRSDGRDETTATFIIRVLTGNRITIGQRERLLHIEITDKEDHFFLYTLDVSEDEFHRLKHDQSLLVEFSEFPSNVIALLNACKETSATFSAVLDTCSSSSLSSSSNSTQQQQQGGCTFSIVESNKFKVLKHLSLRLRAGTDASTKKYLAERLQQFQDNNEKLNIQVKKLTNELRVTTNERDTTKISLDTCVTRQKSEMESLIARTSSEQVSLTSKFNAEMANLQRDHSNEILQIQENHEAATVAMRTRCEKLENERASLMENRATIAAEKMQLEAAHKGSGDLIVSLRDELNTLRNKNQSLDETNFLNNKKVAQLTAQLESHEQEINDKSNVLKQMEMRLEESGDQRGQLEDALSLLRDNQERLHNKFQDSVNEITKGNDIIQKLQNENKQLRGKLKIKSKVVRRQEEAINEKVKEIDEYHRTQLSLEADVQRRKDENQHLNSSIKRLNTKLNESKKLLESNQQVIKWLNQEINTIQLTGRRGLSPAHLGLKELEKSSAFRFAPKITITPNSTMQQPSKNISLQYRPLNTTNENVQIDSDETMATTKRLTAKIKSVHVPLNNEFNAAGMFGDDVPLPLQSPP